MCLAKMSIRAESAHVSAVINVSHTPPWCSVCFCFIGNVIRRLIESLFILTWRLYLPGTG